MTRVRPLVGLAAVPLVLLTGCGTNQELAPGLAARVGDQTVSTHRVADLATTFCSAVSDQLSGQALANHYVNSRVAGSLVLRSAAEQFLADNHAQPDSSYAAAVKQAEAQLGSMSTAERDAIVEVQGAETYVAAATTAVGRQELGGSASADQAAAAGEKKFEAWLDDHHVVVDPRYGLAIKKGQAVLEDTGLSYALSQTATKADATQPDATYAAGLPSTQRCG